MGDRDRPGPPRRPDRRRELRAGASVEDGRDPGLSRSGPGRGARPGRHRPPLLTPARGARGGRHLQPRDHQRHRVRQEPRLQPARPRRHRRRRQASRALPLPDQGPRPGPGAEARRAATPGPARGDLRRRHPARGAPRDPPPQQPRPHQPRHAPRRAAAQPPQLGRLPRQPRLGRRRRGPHLPRRLRLPRRQRPAAAAPGCPRLRLRAALPARLGDDRQPGRTRRAPGRRAVRADLRRRGPEHRARDRDVEPAADRQGDRDPALAALGGGRDAGRARLPGGADDLLPQEPARDRADPALRPRGAHRPRQARAGGADRALPRRLHPAAAARDRGPAQRRRAAGGGRDRRARARDRHRRARRRDLRHLPGDGGEPAPDVGAGRPPPPRPRRLRRRPGRPRPVLLPPPRRVHRPPGRGRDPRPRKRADRLPPPGRRRLRAAAERRGRRDLRPELARSAPTGSSAPGSCAGPAPDCCRAAASSSPRRSRCARPRPTRSR